MKSVLPALFMLACATAFGQPQPPNEKAKAFYDKFQKIVEEIKKKETENLENKTAVLKQLADNAMTQIGHIKKRDPNYNASPLEAIVQPYLDAQRQAVERHNNRIAVSLFHDTDEGCYGLFKANTTTEFREMGNMDEDERKHSLQLEAYNQKLRNILANYMDGVETCRSYLTNRTDWAKKNAAEYKNKIDNAVDEIIVRRLFREVTGKEAYWNAARQLYPDAAAIADVHKLFNDITKSDGGLAGQLAKARARKAERLKNIFMPRAVMTNAAIEAEFKEAFANGGWGETILKINILSREWTVIRNSLTGAILYRSINAAIASKQKGGNCILYNYTIRQQHTGSGFSSVSSYNSHNIIEAEFLCENAR